MKNSAYYRQIARELMADRWKIYGVIMLLFMLMTMALSSVPYLGAVATVLISGAVSLSAVLIDLAFIKGQDVEIGNMFDGFKNYANATVLALHKGIVIFLWSLLFIIPGIVMGYSYHMAFYILAENPGMSSKEAMAESKNLMQGHKFELFKLQLSFIGWTILSIFTLGILMFWLSPYINIATAVFYTDLKMAKYGTADPYTEKMEQSYSHDDCGNVCGESVYQFVPEQEVAFDKQYEPLSDSDFTVSENNETLRDE